MSFTFYEDFTDPPEDGRMTLLGLRVEAWQRDLDVGDCFCVVPNRGPVMYGQVLPPLDEEQPEPGLRRVRLYSDHIPKGADAVLHVKYSDLPVTRAQFEHARRLGWPSAASAWRALLCLAAPASA